MPFPSSKGQLQPPCFWLLVSFCRFLPLHPSWPPHPLQTIVVFSKRAGLKGAAPLLLEVELLFIFNPLKIDSHLCLLKRINRDLLMAELRDLLTVPLIICSICTLYQLFLEILSSSSLCEALLACSFLPSPLPGLQSAALAYQLGFPYHQALPPPFPPPTHQYDTDPPTAAGQLTQCTQHAVRVLTLKCGLSWFPLLNSATPQYIPLTFPKTRLFRLLQSHHIGYAFWLYCISPSQIFHFPRLLV